MIKNIPIYDIVVDLDDPELHMTAISLVDMPAVEKDFMCFKEQHKLDFTVQSEDQHLIFGPAILCDVPIYRYNPTDGEFYVRFTREAIENIVFKYSQEQLLNVVSLQHNGEPIQGATMVEFFLKDTDKGIDPKGYEDCPNYSLFVTYKITDEKLWDEIKNGNELNGYSIEVTAELRETDETVEEEDYDDELEALLRELLGDDVEFDWLWSSEKKKSELDFATDWSVIEKAIENENELSIKYGDRTIKGTPYKVIEGNNTRYLAVYGGDEWHLLSGRYVGKITETGKSNLVNWGEAIKQPDFDWVAKKVVEVSDAVNASPYKSRNDYERAINENLPAMCTYIDEVGRETGICVGNRQVQVMELGFTPSKGIGKPCIRVYQHFGPTHHTDDPIPAWRNLRLDRIRSFRIIDWMEPYTSAPIGYNETGPDRDGFKTTLRSNLKVN